MKMARLRGNSPAGTEENYSKPLPLQTYAELYWRPELQNKS